MRTKFKGLWTLLLALVVQISFAQQKKVSGTVTDANTGEPLPSVNVMVQGTQKGTVTDFDGKYSIMASADDVLVFSFTGYNEKKVKVGNQSVINVQLVPGEQLGTVVVDISNRRVAEKTLSYAVQPVDAKKLEISDLSNVESALSGKVAGAQVWEQAGSKLGYSPKVRLRGRISLSTDSDALYVVDGVPVGDPSVIDPDDVASINVLKGPNATAIYGQRGENGVVQITTKSAKTGKFGVDLSSKVTFENIAYLPKYQNWYGQGYMHEQEWMQYDYAAYSAFGNQYAEWADPAFQGAYFIRRTWVDESWGPKFDGRDYMPWYAWVPGSPYFGKTAKWEARPDNVKNFYDTGVYIKNNVALYSATDKYKARLSFSNLSQKGVVPFSSYGRYFLNSNFSYNVTKKLKVGLSAIYSQYKRHGDFDDQYGNQTSGSFNAWFARDLDMKKQKELIDLKTPEGYLASWNAWGPFYMAVLPLYGYGPEWLKKPVFWFNHYTWLDRYDRNGYGNNLTANVSAEYKINKPLSVKVNFSRYQSNRNSNFHLPYEIDYSSEKNLYMSWVNSFGEYKSNYTEDNYNAFLFYNKMINDDLSFDGMLGTTLRVNNYYSLQNWMNPEDTQNGLIIPDVYRFDNTKKPVTGVRGESHKKVYSVFGKVTLGYKDMLFLEATGRQDWSSALFPDHNGYFYPSVGLTYNFTDMDMFKDNENLSKILSNGKFRIGWAQVGSDVGAHMIYPRYPILSGVPYQGYATLVTPSYFVDPNLKPALNSSFETGLDLKFLEDRAGLSFTYYYEKRQDEIIFQAISPATGYSSFLTNGGKSHRSGIELTLSGSPVKTKDFEWNIDVNFAKNKTIVDEVPGDSEEMLAPGGRWTGGDTWARILLVHAEGQEWGQLKGYDIKRDANGNPVLSPTGMYITTDEQVYFGSVLPDFTGGITNVLTYKDFSLAAHFTFQKGGKFYSGSEVWGYYSGLYEETGNNGHRDLGVTVEGVDVNGTPVSHTVDTRDYYEQFHDNTIPGPFIHDASFFKLRELSLTYHLPKKLLGGKYLKGASIGIIGTNVWLIAVSKDNYHRWDPSELSQVYGEDAQLPGTRRYGVNIKLNF